MQGFNIRNAHINDVQAIARVQYLGWQDTYKHIYPASYLNNLPVKTAMWQKILSNPSPEQFNIVLINPQNEIIGFASGGKNRFGELKVEAEIYALYLLTSYHGKGLGQQLFLHAIQHMGQIGYTSFCLFVLTLNPSINFYRKFNPDMETTFKEELEGKEYEETGFGWTNVQNTILQAKN